ncbi:hypothetical protein ASZ78_007976, partial [Callipepla squamata]
IPESRKNVDLWMVKKMAFLEYEWRSSRKGLKGRLGLLQSEIEKQGRASRKGYERAGRALRDNRIELVRASWHELSISVSDVSLSDEGQYTCSLFTMPVKTSKAFLTVLGVPEKPQITGFTSPVMEGERMQLTCKTSGSKPAADIRWFKNDKEVKDVKYLKEEDANRKTFTVSSTLDFLADRNDDGAVVSCRVDHESLNSTPQIAMQVLEIHCK